MKELGIIPGINAAVSTYQSDIKRIKNANKRKQQYTHVARRAKERAKLSLTLKNLKEEGVTYEHGAF